MIRLILAMILLVAAPLSPLSSVSAAPPAPDPLATQFAADAAQHVRDLYDLFSMRGIRPKKMDNPSLADAAAYLATNRADSSPGYPAGSAMLFYAHHGDRLAIYLVGNAGLIAHHEARIAQDDLRYAAAMLRIDLEVDGLDRSRAPVWTGPARAPVKITTSRPTRYTPIADILLPAPIRTALTDVRHLIIIANGVIATNPFAAFPLTDKELLIDRMSVTVSAGLFDLDQMIRPWGGRNEFRGMLLVGDPLVPRTPEWKARA